MEGKHKIIILALIIIIVALLAGILISMPGLNKQDSSLTFESKTTLTEGDYLQIKLTDAHATALANQTVNLTITDKDNANSYYSVVTDDDGIGKLKLDKDAGNYVATLSYGGNGNYNGCNASEQITIEEDIAEAEVTSSSTDSDSTTHVVMGEDGYYALIDDNGNILEDLGPSKKYHPNDPNAVDYPDAEPMGNYIDKSLG